MLEVVYILVFVVGLMVGMVVPTAPASPKRSYPKCHLDDVDEMVLWGEVTNDPFYKGE